MAVTYTPVIVSAILSPNPAKVGQQVLISISATDVASEPSTFVPTSGEFASGEV